MSEPGRRDASMLLLTSLIESSLDEGYTRAAARRRAGEGRPARAGILLTVGLLAVGLLLATAAAQTRARSDVTAQARAALMAEIEDRQRASSRLETELARLRERTSADRRAALRLTAQGSELAASLTRLESVTGAGAVVGPGLVVRLEDAPETDGGADTDPRTEESDDGRVTDRDLQTVVNEIWAAGAEAVSVNGQRLTALSAIRAAGEAVLVDFRPLVPPYTVSAVGPPTLRADFVSGFGGSYLQVLRDYGITYSLDERSRVRLPASGGLALRQASTPGDVRSDPTTTDDEEGS